MLKVLIADDEKIVQESIKFILTKEFGETLDIVTCSSGNEALEYLTFNTVHITFIDIKMPDIDGLEIIEEIRKNKVNVFPIFIVVSAHDKFEFAKKAVDIGAFSYILKPYSTNDIINITKHAIEYVNNQLSKLKEDLEKNTQLKVMRQLIENSFLFTLTYNHSFDILDIDQYEKIFNISLKSGFFSVIKLKEKNEIVNDFELVENIKKDIKLVFNKRVLASSGMGDIIVLFFPSDNKLEAEDLKNQFLDTLKQKSYFYLIKIGFSQFYHIVDGFEKAFWEAYNQAVNLNEERNENDIYLEIDYLENKILYALNNSVSIASIETVINELYVNYREAYGMQNIKYKIIKLIIMLLTESNINKKDILSEIEESIITLINTQDNNLLIEMKSTILKIISENKTNQEKILSNDIISAVINYLKDNYTNEISLSQISSQYNLSSYYFSKLFKKSLGINFKEYITRLRVNKATELLRTTNLSIKEISYAVGFDDPNYFVKIFKKVTGSTPTSYRVSN
ncbi:response regulator [Caldicellulosiruptoraceae bacterium PP1]